MVNLLFTASVEEGDPDGDDWLPAFSPDPPGFFSLQQANYFF
jgi:hypothetical protein